MTDRLTWDPKTGGTWVTDGWLRMEPVIPCLSPLTDLIRAHPEDSEFRWNGKVWEVA